MTLDGKDLPELRDVHVDDVITVKLTLKATRITEGGYDWDRCDCDEECDCPKTDKNKVSGNFEVQNAEFVNIKSADSSNESKVARKYSELIKKGVKPATAMKQARKG